MQQASGGEAHGAVMMGISRAVFGNPLMRMTNGRSSGEPALATVGWEHLRHGADIGVRGWGGSLQQAFEETALALTAVVTDPVQVRQNERVLVHCDAPDPELMLMSWLNAVVYEMAVRDMLFSGFRVTLAGDRLYGELRGEKLDVDRHQPAVEVKGATCTGLRVACERGRWIAECVVDV